MTLWDGERGEQEFSSMAAHGFGKSWDWVDWIELGEKRNNVIVGRYCLPTADAAAAHTGT